MITLTVAVATLVLSALTLYILVVFGLEANQKREAFDNSSVGKLVNKFVPGFSQ